MCFAALAARTEAEGHALGTRMWETERVHAREAAVGVL